MFARSRKEFSVRNALPGKFGAQEFEGVMTEETTKEQEGGVAAAESHEGHEHHDHDHDHDHDHAHEGPKPISISGDLLTEEAKKEIKEQTGKPVKDIPYQVLNRETLKNSTLGLKFEVAAEEFKKQLDEYYEKLRADVVLPGFRKGKAPVKLIRIRMGNEGDQESMTQTATNVLRQEAIKEKLEIIGDARIVKWEIAESKPLQFEIYVEIEPKVVLSQYKGLKVEVETLEITDEMVENRIKALASDFATWEAAPAGHKLAEGDGVVVDVKVLGDKGQELKHMARENAMLTQYKAQVNEQIAEKMTGAEVGATIEAEIKQTRETRKGEKIESADTHQVTIKEIKIRKLAEINDELAKDLGKKDLAELRSSTRKELEDSQAFQERSQALNRLTFEIIKQNPFDVPSSLIFSERYRAILRDEQELARMGLRLENVVQDADQYMHGQYHAAEGRIKQAYVFGELAKIEKIEVSDEDLEKEIALMAEKSGRKPLAIRAKLEAEKRLETMKNQLLDRKIADFIIANNTIEKVAPKAPEAEAEGEKASEGKAKPKTKAKTKAKAKTEAEESES